MPQIGLTGSAQGALQLKALSGRLRKAGRGDLRKKLRDQIKKAGRPVVAEVRTAISTLQVTSGGAISGRVRGRAQQRQPGLRRAIAAATKLEITVNGVRVVVRKNALPEDQQSLPRNLDKATGWRHPVFGNTDRWVSQRGGPWFAVTIHRSAPTFRRAIVQAMDDITRDIEA